MSEKVKGTIVQLTTPENAEIPKKLVTEESEVRSNCKQCKAKDRAYETPELQSVHVGLMQYNS